MSAARSRRCCVLETHHASLLTVLRSFAACRLKTYGLHSAMDQFAAERNAEKLCIRYVSGPCNQSMSFARSQEERGTHRGTQQRCLRLSCNDLGCRPCSCKSLQVLMNRSLSRQRSRLRVSSSPPFFPKDLARFWKIGAIHKKIHSSARRLVVPRLSLRQDHLHYPALSPPFLAVYSMGVDPHGDDAVDSGEHLQTSSIVVMFHHVRQRSRM